MEYKYRYLISYGYKSNVYIKEVDKYFESMGSGCMILDSGFKILTIEDIDKTNKNLLKILDEKIDNLQSVNLYSFSLLEGE